MISKGKADRRSGKNGPHPPGGRPGKANVPLEEPKGPRQLYVKYYLAAVAFFARHGFGREESRDLAQETFLRVHKGRKTYREEGQWAYVLKIAKNVRRNAIRARRAKKRNAATHSIDEESGDGRSEPLRDAIAGETPTPEEALLAQERQAMLERAVAQLPTQMRRCIQMRLYGLKYREIGEALGITMDTVKRTLYQARIRLKETVGAWVEEPFREAI